MAAGAWSRDISLSHGEWKGGGEEEDKGGAKDKTAKS